MKVYLTPKVQLIARPQIVRQEIDRFLTDHDFKEDGGWIQEDSTPPTDGDSLPEFAGRMCYVSFGAKQGKKTNQSYIQNIIEQGHGSVLEHSNWTFLVSQCSRGLTHELVRHRSGFAYSQESTHYIDYSDPKNWAICLDPRLNSNSTLDFVKLVEAAQVAFMAYGNVYNDLRDQGMAKKEACSIARQVLPTGIESKICFTANARALRHLLEYRGHAGNVLEIRLMALEVFKIMQSEAPSIFQDISVIQNSDGYGEIYSQHRKV